jgi:hypothetical protein
MQKIGTSPDTHSLETLLYFAPNSHQVVYVEPQHTPNPSLSLSSRPLPLPPPRLFQPLPLPHSPPLLQPRLWLPVLLCSRRRHVCRFYRTRCCILLIVVCPRHRHSCHCHHHCCASASAAAAAAAAAGAASATSTTHRCHVCRCRHTRAAAFC